MHLIQLFLPLRDNTGRAVDATQFALVRRELIDRFGGVTTHVRAPARGVWKDDDSTVEHDDVVTFEVVVPAFDRDWWTHYRETLEARFGQTSIHGRVLPVALL